METIDNSSKWQKGHTTGTEIHLIRYKKPGIIRRIFTKPEKPIEPPKEQPKKEQNSKGNDFHFELI
jgi:hypothetical protein